MSDAPNNRERLPGDEVPYDDEDIHIIHSQLLREKDEPSEGFSPVPMIMLFLFGGLIFWGGVYIANFRGDFRWDVYDPHWQPGMTQATVEIDPVKAGERIYNSQCASCHQGNGAGVPGSFPPLAGSAWVLGDEKRIVKILLKGLSGPIEVEGNSYNGNMPAFGDGPGGMGWDDAKISYVSTYVRSAWGNGGSAVTEETVAEARAEVADKTTAWSGEEILEQHPL